MDCNISRYHRDGTSNTNITYHESLEIGPFLKFGSHAILSEFSFLETRFEGDTRTTGEREAALDMKRRIF